MRFTLARRRLTSDGGRNAGTLAWRQVRTVGRTADKSIFVSPEKWRNRRNDRREVTSNREDSLDRSRTRRRTNVRMTAAFKALIEAEPALAISSVRNSWI